MSAPKIIAIVVLVVIGAHLLLFGFLRRMIAQAKADAERRDGSGSRGGESPAPGPGPQDQNGRL